MPREGDELTRLPFLRTWFRTRSAIVLHLSNGTMQVLDFLPHHRILRRTNGTVQVLVLSCSLLCTLFTSLHLSLKQGTMQTET